jgi:hypothetical protein
MELLKKETYLKREYNNRKSLHYPPLKIPLGPGFRG